MRHPGLKLNTPPQVFCMGWCNLTLSSGGYAGDAMKYCFVPVFLEPFVQNEEVRANPSGILFVWWHASACSGILFLWRASACSGTPLCVFGVASGIQPDLALGLNTRSPRRDEMHSAMIYDGRADALSPILHSRRASRWHTASHPQLRVCQKAEGKLPVRWLVGRGG